MLQIIKQIKRYQRLLKPSKAEQRFIYIMGRWWFFWHGVKREYPLGPFYIDFAIPRKKIAIEVDGRLYHQDVVREYDRDLFIYKQRWHVIHIQARELWKRPQDVRRYIKEFVRDPIRYQKKYDL